MSDPRESLLLMGNYEFESLLSLPYQPAQVGCQYLTHRLGVIDSF